MKQTTKLTAFVPRVRDEVVGMADWYNVKLLACTKTYDEHSIEGYMVTVEGRPMALNEYIDNVDGEIEEIE